MTPKIQVTEAKLDGIALSLKSLYMVKDKKINRRERHGMRENISEYDSVLEKD